MRDYSMDEIKALCLSTLPVGVPFIDDRLERYRILYAGNHAYYAVLKAITEALQPGIVVEIGGWTGTSAACFAAGCPAATVVTIDHHSDPGDDINQLRMFEAVQAFPNIRYVQGSSTQAVADAKPGLKNIAPDVIQFLDGRKIDILFIDGWHSSEYARADYDTYAPYLSENALVICDDLTSGDSSGHIGMLSFWENLPGKEKYLDGVIHPGYPMGFLKCT